MSTCLNLIDAIAMRLAELPLDAPATAENEKKGAELLKEIGEDLAHLRRFVFDAYQEGVIAGKIAGRSKERADVLALIDDPSYDSLGRVRSAIKAGSHESDVPF